MAGTSGSHAVERTTVSRYRLFASVRVSHDYFADGCARHMMFLPHVETAAFLRRFDMQLRVDGQSLGISVCDSQWPGIWSERLDGSEPRMLCFDVYSSDPACAYYTDEVIAESQVEDSAELPVLLRPVTSSASAPLVTIALPLNAAATENFSAWTAALGTLYRLRMSSRSTVWKYLLVGNWHDRKLAIADQRGEVTFTTPSPEHMPDGRYALVARSMSTITLQERPDQRFQLRDITDSPERILIPRLPGAKPQSLWREMQGSTSTVVSEIFVHC